MSAKKHPTTPKGPIGPVPKKTRFLQGRNLKILIVVIIAVLATSTYAAYTSSQGSQPKAVFINWQVLIFAGSYNATHFTTPAAQNIEAKGGFTAVGGNGKILTLIVSDYDFQTYITANVAPPSDGTYYNSTTTHTGSFDIHLPASQQFWIVFWDNFNEGRAVTANGYLYY